MFLITYAIPILGLAGESINVTTTYKDPNQNYRLKFKHLDDGRLPPNPGEMPEDFIIKTPENIQMIYNPLDKTASSIHETIIEIIKNLEDELILGYLENITAFGPRVTGSNACQQAGEYIYNEFESYGLEARYDDWSNSGYSGNNIEGTLYGINETSDEIYIICAHYDSVSGSPGADDDGSGTAAVLAAAYLMSQNQFNHTIRFVAFDGEEQGLLGSYRYAEEAYNNGDNIVATLNGDMIGYAENPTQASYIKIYENSASEWITDFTEDISQLYYDYIELTIVPSGPAYNSDHASFWNFGYNAIFYHEYQFNPYYHSSQDIIENMNINYSTRVSRLMTATLGELAEAQIYNIPPDKPIITGPTTGEEGAEITIYFSSTDPDGHDLYYLVDWGDETNSGWLGLYASGEECNATHHWTIKGDYEIKAKAKDICGAESDWSEPHIISIVGNIPPDAPVIYGPTRGKPGVEYTFTFNAIDPDGHDIAEYTVRWGDSPDEIIEGPFASGAAANASHSWDSQRTYTIKAKAKDICGAESNWSEFEVEIPRNRATVNSLFHWLLERFPLLEKLLSLIRVI